jgi:hypothetical protein
MAQTGEPVPATELRATAGRRRGRSTQEVIAISRVIEPSWVAIVRATADSLEAELKRCGAGPEADHVIVRESIHEARAQAERPALAVTGSLAGPRRLWRRAGSWWTGQDVDRAWGALHLADQSLLQIQDEAVVKAQLADMAASVVLSFPGSDIRRKDYLKTLQLLAPAERPIGPADRAQLRIIRQGCDSTSDAGHADARSFRNGLTVVGALLAVVLVAIAVMGWVDTGLRSVFAGTDASKSIRDLPGAWYVFELELVGSIAGVTGAVFAMHNYSGFQSLYGLPVVQTILKGGTGAATALLGVGLIQSGIVTTVKAETSLGVFGLAVVFGYAQYLFTRLVDQQAQKVLKSASSRNSPGTTPEVAPGDDAPELLTTDAADGEAMGSARLDHAVRLAEADPTTAARIEAKVAQTKAAAEARDAGP